MVWTHILVNIYRSLITYSLLLIMSVVIFWLSYNIFISLKALRSSSHKDHANIENNLSHGKYPSVSIIVPVRNEVKVVSRVLEALLKQDYPTDKYEIIVVDGMSSDGTYEQVMGFASKYRDKIKVIRETDPNGKARALNLGLSIASGEIIGIFDADAVPPRNVIRKAVSLLMNGEDVIQGRLLSINESYNLLTRLISLEEKAWYNLLMNGRSKLSLFIPLVGNCYFLKKKVLEELNGWRDDSLTEDIELSLRLLKHGYTVKYADNVVTYQEAPDSIGKFVGQRIRWYRGYLSNLLRYGSLLESINMRHIDAELLLMGPLIMVLSLVGYIIGLLGLIDIFTNYLSMIMLILVNTLALATIAIILIINRPIALEKIILAFSIYPYWILEAVLALIALVEEIIRFPRRWDRTEKTGRVTEIVK